MASPSCFFTKPKHKPSRYLHPPDIRRSNNLPAEENWLLASGIRMTQGRQTVINKNVIRLKDYCLNHEEPRRKLFKISNCLPLPTPPFPCLLVLYPQAPRFLINSKIKYYTPGGCLSTFQSLRRWEYSGLAGDR